MTSAVYAGVREILAAPDWEPVTVTDHGLFFTISGYFRSMAHTGSRKDWESLARDLDRIAREQFNALMGEAKPGAEAIAEPVVEAAPEPTPEPEPEPAPEPQPDPRDAELEAMRAKIEALEAAKRELEERELELRDANATLKDALADIEDRIADLDDEDDAHKFPASYEKLSDWDVVGANGAEDLIPAEVAARLSGIGISPKSGETMPAFTARLRAHYNDIAGKRHAGIGDIEVIDAEIEIISAVLDQIIGLTPKVGS